MANANQFQPSRPQPLYQQVHQVQRQPNIGFLAGQLPGILQSVGALKGLFSESPADQYNLALANDANTRAMENVWKRIRAVKDPEDRKKLFLEEQNQNPSLMGKYNADNINFSNLEENDPMKLGANQAQRGMVDAFQNTQQGNFGMDMVGNPSVPVQPTEPGQTADGIGSQQTLSNSVPAQQQEGLPVGDWTTTQVPVEPTIVDAVNAQMPEGEVSQESPITTQWSENETPPQPTEVRIPQGAPTQEEQRKVEAMRMLNSRGYPVTQEDIWISPHTGEAKLNPALATRFPEFGPGAYEDVLAAGPEDAGIRQSVTESVPNMVDNQLRAMQLGSIMRVARSYDLGVQPAMEDIYSATMPLTDLKLLAADLRVKTGLPYDEDMLDPEFMRMAKAYGQWRSKATPDDIRNDPETLELVMKSHSLPPEYRKLIESIGEHFANGEEGYQEYKYKMQQLSGLQQFRDAQIANDEYKNKADYTVGLKRSESAQLTAEASWENALTNRMKLAQEQEWNKARTKKALAEIGEIERKKQVEESSLTKQEMDLIKLANENNIRGMEVPSQLLSKYSELAKNERSILNHINGRIGALVEEMPTAQSQAIGHIVVNATARNLTTREVETLKQNNVTEAVITELAELRKQRADSMANVKTYNDKMSFHAEQWETAITNNSTLPQQQAQMLDGIRQLVPAVGDSVMRNMAVKNLKHPAASQIFNMLEIMPITDVAKLTTRTLPDGKVENLTARETVDMLRNPKSPFHVGYDVVENDSDLARIMRGYIEWYNLLQTPVERFSPKSAPK